METVFDPRFGKILPSAMANSLYPLGGVIGTPGKTPSGSHLHLNPQSGPHVSTPRQWGHSCLEGMALELSHSMRLLFFCGLCLKLSFFNLEQLLMLSASSWRGESPLPESDESGPIRPRFRSAFGLQKQSLGAWRAPQLLFLLLLNPETPPWAARSQSSSANSSASNADLSSQHSTCPIFLGSNVRTCQVIEAALCLSDGGG